MVTATEAKRTIVEIIYGMMLRGRTQHLLLIVFGFPIPYKNLTPNTLFFATVFARELDHTGLNAKTVAKKSVLGVRFLYGMGNPKNYGKEISVLRNGFIQALMRYLLVSYALNRSSCSCD
jgi:hypothetical protein